MRSFMCFLLVAFVASPAYGERSLYVNFAPDVRYSLNGEDSRIALDSEKQLYAYGHDFGVLAACADGSSECLVFDFMALYDLPNDVVVGAEYVVGQYRFIVSKEVDLSLLGSKRNVLRVDVSKNGERSNSYLMDQSLGVVAIIILNFGNDEIPESIFFLQGPAGVFAESE